MTLLALTGSTVYPAVISSKLYSYIKFVIFGEVGAGFRDSL